MQHLMDYVWMQLGDAAPVQVQINGLENKNALTEHLAAGFRQVDEPQALNKEGE